MIPQPARRFVWKSIRRLIFLFCTHQALGQAFITTWKTDNPGNSASNQITITTTGTGYAYSIYWEQVANANINGTISGPITGNHTITFPTPGVYKVHISGNFPRIYFNAPFNPSSDGDKILTIEQWGNIVWKSMASAFAFCRNLTIPAQDVPNLTQVTDLSFMFNGATSFNQPINSWDVSHILTMSRMFAFAKSFNQPLNSWNVSQVTNMSHMFADAQNFNQSIEAWNVSNVTDMTRMFSGAQKFNQPLSAWNVSKVKSMAFMFFDAQAFNQPIGSWDMSNVNDIQSMFWQARSFNQSLDSWNVSAVTTMNKTFANATVFNQSIGSWNVGNVTDMTAMFTLAENFNQPIGSWNVSKVTNMTMMFTRAINFNQSIGLWDVRNVTSMNAMFAGAPAFNQPIGAWNVGKVTDMKQMFGGAASFNQPINSWNVSRVTDMSSMFLDALSFNQPIGSWDIQSVIDMTGMFFNASSFDQSLRNWKISNITQMYSLLTYSGVSTNNYDETLIGWAAQNVKFNVSLGVHGLTYCRGAAARAQLVAKGWFIQGDASQNPPDKPIVDVQQPVCFETKGSIIVSIQSPNDVYSFDGGVNFQISNIATNLAPGQYSVLISNGCHSLTQSAVVNQPPPIPPKPILSGSAVVCPNAAAINYSANIQTYTYQWFASGGSVQWNQNNHVKVNWGPSNSNASLKALGFDSNNCPTDTAFFSVNIQALKPSKPIGQDSVCFNFRTGVPYQTSNTNGSVFTWFADGGVVSQGQGTSQVEIDWVNAGTYQLWLKEERSLGSNSCEGLSDTLHVLVLQDLTAIVLSFVSVEYEDDSHVQLQWEISSPERVSDPIKVSRKIAGSSDSWQQVVTLERNATTFTDQNLATSVNVYEYKLAGLNKCNDELQTVIHNTIKLTGEKIEEKGSITLYWNDYNGWDEVGSYEVWRKLDDDADYRLIGTTAGNANSYLGSHGADGFVQRFRIKARKKNSYTSSWSNPIQFDFENPIEIPNVITPNGDSWNDHFVIPKIHLYPDNTLLIVDRWGKTVFSKRGYDNSWNASDAQAGVYFYSLHIAGMSKTLTGWIQVVK